MLLQIQIISEEKHKSYINVLEVHKFKATLCETISPFRRSWLLVLLSLPLPWCKSSPCVPNRSWGVAVEGAAGGGAAAARHWTVGAAPAPLLRAVLAHGTRYTLAELLLPAHKQFCFCLKTFPHQCLPSSEDCSLRLLLNFFGNGDEII